MLLLSVQPSSGPPSRQRASPLAPWTARAWFALLLLLGAWMLGAHAAGAPPASAAASAPQAVLSTLSHTAWTRRQDAPANIYQIAQDADGWLWLGTQDGLYRFDGLRFEHVDGASQGVMALLGTPDGDLWIGTTDGRVLRRRAHGTDVYEKVGGGGLGPPVAFALAPEGGLLVAFNHGLFRFDQGRWQRLPMPGHERDIFGLVVDASGAVWLQDDGDVLVRPQGKAEFHVVTRTYPHRFFAPLVQGGVLTSELEGSPLVLRQDTGATPLRKPPEDGALTGTIGLDRDGRLWVSAFPDGIDLYDRAKVEAWVAHAVPLAAPERMSLPQGLSGKHVWSIFQDREGNVWLGTNAGLDRFRPTKLTPAPLDEAGQAALAAADGGGVWVGRWNLPWARVDARGPVLAPEGNHRPYARMNCAYRSRRGTVWLCGNHGFLKVAAGRREQIPYPPEMGTNPLDDNGQFVQTMTEDGEGDLWVSGTADHLMRWHAGRWDAEPWPGSGPGRVLAADTLADGTLCMARRDDVQCRSPADGHWRGCMSTNTDIGAIVSLQAYGDRLWIGGSDGIAWMQGCQSHALGTKGQRGPMRNVSGIVQTPDGELWFNSAEGVGHLRKPALDGLMAGGSALAVPIDLLDQDDGLDGTPEQVRPVPTAIRAVDGTLWFTTSAGTYWIDPAHVRRNQVAPTLKIERIAADDHTYSVQSAALALPPDPQRVVVTYTALSLSMPQRVRFEYRLDGIDTRWTDAGMLREAVYTALPPGRYKFRLRAWNEDGVPSAGEQTFAFEVRPAFTETWGFRAACALLSLLLLAAALRWRIVLSMRRLRERMRERLVERERIARELHDTLLQSMTGLVLKLDAVVGRLPRDEPARGSLERLLQQTEQAIVEGRDRIGSLRAVDEDGSGLMKAIEDAGRRLALEHEQPGGIHLETNVTGEVRALQAVACHEALWIAREALTNAFRHARASRIVVSIDYRSEHFVMRVDDDGQGIAPIMLEAGGRAGHWGLRGMRERADQIAGRLVVGPSRAGGTCVELTLPAAVMYEQRRPGPPSPRRHFRFARLLWALRLAR